jgi:cell wall-associated NlpC family hydrolase
MGKFKHYLSLSLMTGLLTLFFTASYPTLAEAHSSKPRVTHSSKKHKQPTSKAAPQTIVCATRQHGKRYRRGGSSPSSGFDCSGLTQYAFRQGSGVHIPRTAAAQYQAASKISRKAARPGDLVFFQTRGRRIGHVGIYLGNGKFVHAPRPGKAVTTEALSGYWSRHLVGFGRIAGKR